MWDSDSLWTKAQLFFERTFELPRDDPHFGLWCALGLEALSRAAVSSVHPGLLAESDRNHKHLLQVVRDVCTDTFRSISTEQVICLCKEMFEHFKEDDVTVAKALSSRRNIELHTGTAAFAQYPQSQWLYGLYHACKILAETMDKSLADLFGNDEGNAATLILDSRRDETRAHVRKLINAARTMFDQNTSEERDRISMQAAKEADELAYVRHHRVTCPACQSAATVTGEVFGPERVEHNDDEVIVRRSVSPTEFCCSACDLKLSGYAELDEAGIGGLYTRRSTYSPSEYYGLLDPDVDDLSEYVERYLREMEEYDNE